MLASVLRFFTRPLPLPVAACPAPSPCTSGLLVLPLPLPLLADVALPLDIAVVTLGCGRASLAAATKELSSGRGPLSLGSGTCALAYNVFGMVLVRQQVNCASLCKCTTS